jgi:hypothetical protein
MSRPVAYRVINCSKAQRNASLMSGPLFSCRILSG